MRIAMVITTLQPGDAERSMTSVAIGLRQRNFEPSVHVLDRSPPDAKDQLRETLHAAGVRCHFMGLRRPYQLVRGLLMLRRQLLDAQPAAVLSFLYHANVLSGLALRRLPIPLVTSVRVDDPRVRRLRIEAWATARARRVICVSQQVARRLESRARIHPDRLETIPNSIAADDYAGVEPADLTTLGIPDSSPTLVFAGRLDRQKGIDWLVRQMPGLLARLPNLHLLILGVGPQARRIDRAIEQQRLGQQVHRVGWQDQIAPFLRAATLLVAPSRWEGMPNVVLEAMACRRPVACSDQSGAAELLGPLAAEQTFVLGDAASLIECVTSACSDPARSKRLGEANYQRCVKHFSREKMLDRYQRILCQIAES